jgi:hypothetical protein
VSLVLDASLAFSWYFEDKRTEAVNAVLDEVVETGAVVLALWRLAIVNGFQNAIRRKRIDMAFRDRAIAQLAASRSPSIPILTRTPGRRRCGSPTSFSLLPTTPAIWN